MVHSVRMSVVKRIPDVLTFSRGVIACAVFTLGFVGRAALEAVIVLTIIGWTTDILDGRIARRIKKPPTWIGDQEFTFDMLMVFSGLCYFVMAGFIDALPAVMYCIAAAVCIGAFRSKMVTMSFATPLVALPLIVSYFEAPHALLWYLAWIAAALALDWKRFKGVVREFIENARQLARR